MGVDAALDPLDAAVGARVAVAGAQASPLVIVTTGSRDRAWRVVAVEAALLAAAGGSRLAPSDRQLLVMDPPNASLQPREVRVAAAWPCSPFTPSF